MHINKLTKQEIHNKMCISHVPGVKGEQKYKIEPK